MNKEFSNQSLIRGMSNVLVFGKTPKNKNINTYSDALKHDLGHFKKDFLNVLTKSVKDLPAESKRELTNELLEIKNK